MRVYPISAVLNGQVPLGSFLTVQGWVRTRRDSKAGLSFVTLHDGSCFASLQIIAPADLPNYAHEIVHLTAGCAIRASGELVASTGKKQTVELRADRIEVVGWVENPETYPIAPKPHTFEYLRTVAHLRPRTSSIGAVMRIRDSLAYAIQRFFHERGYYWVHTPIITASDCEGAGALFQVSTLDWVNPPRTPTGTVDFSQDFFGRETFLTVSGQLNVEAYCLALSKVYTFGPTFRAENSNTSRHLAEFWMVEPETAFADLSANADLAEALLKFIFQAVLAERADDLAFCAERIDKTCMQRLEQVIHAPFERMDYTEAVRVLNQAKRTFFFPIRWGMDLQSEHERYLAEEYIGRPVILMNYPKEIKSFYMRLNDDGRTVAAMDVLAPGMGEIIGGSQREERLEVLDARMDELGMNKAAYDWYRDLRRYGTVPHSGFGLGFERTISYVTGMGNVRDVIPFPRTPRSADF